ncbi:hypothetical protein GCM10009821_26970 [Aeromicrobium halocynthiae]|uniref:Uncharacterized protein n=1 Tax=Aeromicrobium halocynthiae TaxID=560557 RepID=A0ABN2W5F4_9ACTN
MKKHTLGVVSALLAAMVVLLPGHGAHAAQDPYQDAICSVGLSAPRVVSGQSFTVTVTADRPADLSVTFRGETRSRANAAPGQDGRPVLTTTPGIAPAVNDVRSPSACR